MKYTFFDLEKSKKIINLVRKIIYPGLFEKIEIPLSLYKENIIYKIKKTLFYSVSTIEKLMHLRIDYNVIDKFVNEIDTIKEMYENDIKAIKEGDPAALNEIEIVLCYPSAYAILVYRISHVLYELNIPILPRILSECAHEKTGIDIHPGAKIGKNFFIDHGTGIVIGETTIIGNNVKLYQGVTLGAKSLKKVEELKNQKRHPTIKNNVTIYAGASILGGNTVIGNNVTIGSNLFITKSIEDWATVYLGEQMIVLKIPNNN